MARRPTLIVEPDTGQAVASIAPSPHSRPAGHVPVWDVAIRLFHWGLVATVATSYFTGGTGLRFHEIAGSAVAGLLVFRLVWGLVGTPHARFADFIRGPVTLVGYLRDLISMRADRHIGHNPAGGAMILALLATLVVVVTTGFMQLTNYFFGVEWVEQVHHHATNVLLALVALHLLGVITSSWLHRENLVGAMVTGSKPAATPSHPEVVSVPNDGERLSFRLLGGMGLSTLLFMLASGLATGWVLTSGRTVGSVENLTRQSAPSEIIAAIRDQAASRSKDRQDYSASGPEDASLAWLISSGGRLYDNAFASLGTNAPIVQHPAWPRSDTSIDGSETWRCKSCHGWDYIGRAGARQSRPEAPAMPALQRMRGRDPAVLMAVMNDATHQYGDEILPQHAKYRIAMFLSRGLHDAARTIRSNGRAIGDVAQGKAVYQTVCAACHGFDGRSRKLGVSSDANGGGYSGPPLFVGTKAVRGPHEVLHKIRNGHPGVIMVSLRAFPPDAAANLLAYVQTLPVK